jgi:hypothetical protein
MDNANTVFEAARLAIYDGEARGLSKRTMAKRWAAYFRAEDALKANGGGWAR